MDNNTIKLNEKQKLLIERFGIRHEQSGFAPVEARILGLLLVADETELTFDQIQSTLSISKSATSNALNKLLLIGQIEYITRHGDRKRYFRCNLEQWQNLIIDRVKDIPNMNKILIEILEARPKSSKEFNSHLKTHINFVEFMSKELAATLSKWKAK